MPAWGIVVAAGSGARFGSAKQFATVRGERLVDRAVVSIASVCDHVVVVLPPGEEWSGPPVTAVVPGGATRSDSVRAGLAVVSDDADVIVVHDAARPLAPAALFEAVVAAVRAGADAAVPAVAVADTVKRVAGARVVETMPREELVAVQTPQAFGAATLRAAHAAGGDATDDAALVEAAGGVVVVVPGDRRNLKVTDADDLRLADALAGTEAGKR